MSQPVSSKQFLHSFFYFELEVDKLNLDVPRVSGNKSHCFSWGPSLSDYYPLDRDLSSQ